MAEYPNEHVFIVKVKNYTFLAFLSNTNHSRAKFFHSGEVVPTSELRSYVKSKYGQEPEWIRCMEGINPFSKPNPNKAPSFRAACWGATYTPTREEISIRSEIKNAVGSKPFEDLCFYERASDDDIYRSSRKERKILEQRREEAMREYEAIASRYPSFASYTSVNDDEICEVMEWLSGHDKSSPANQTIVVY